MRNNIGKNFLGGFIFLLVLVGATAVVMLLWNWLIPSIIGWQAINFWQALGLIVLCKLLFGGKGHWGGFGHGHHPFRDRNKKEHRELHERMRNMSRDERRDFIRQRMAESGFGPCDRGERPVNPREEE